MNTKTQSTRETNLIIGPDHTTLNREIYHPHNIAIVLENGHSYDIDDVIDILEKIDKKKHKTHARPMRRLRHIKQALSTAIKESLEDDVPMATRDK